MRFLAISYFSLYFFFFFEVEKFSRVVRYLKKYLYNKYYVLCSLELFKKFYAGIS